MPDFGDGSPREDYGAVDQNAPSVANGQISPAQWAEYQSKRRRDYILGMLGVLGGSVGLGFAGQALGGAGAAGASASAGGGLPPVTGGAPWAITPYAQSATMAAPGAAGAGAGAGAGGLFAGMSARDLAALGLSAAGTIGGALSNNNTNTTPTSATTDPQMKELLDLMMNRMRKSEPNFDSAQAMAQGLLPTQYQRGGGGMR